MSWSEIKRALNRDLSSPLKFHSEGCIQTRGKLPITSGGSAVVYNDEIHLFYRGSNECIHQKWTGSEWVSVSTPPSALKVARAVVYNNEIHCLGNDSSNTSGGNAHYKWNGSSWSSVSTLPYTFDGSDAVVYAGKIHILGGTGYGNNHYAWNGSSWSSVSSIGYAFDKGSAVVYNNEIHCLGGYANSYTKTMHYKWNGSSWSSVSTLPYEFYQGTACVFNNKIYIIGSWSNSAEVSTVYSWNGSSWAAETSLPYGNAYGNSFVYKDALTLLGGIFPGGTQNENMFMSYFNSKWVTRTNFLDLYLPANTEIVYDKSNLNISILCDNMMDTPSGKLITTNSHLYVTGEYDYFAYSLRN